MNSAEHYTTRYLEMLLTYDTRVQDSGCRLQRVYSRINTKFYNRTGQNRSCIQMGKCRCRCRVCQVIRRNIYSLYRCDRTILGRSDSLLQSTHFCL